MTAICALYTSALCNSQLLRELRRESRQMLQRWQVQRIHDLFARALRAYDARTTQDSKVLRGYRLLDAQLQIDVRYAEFTALMQHTEYLLARHVIHRTQRQDGTPQLAHIQSQWALRRLLPLRICCFALSHLLR